MTTFSPAFPPSYGTPVGKEYKTIDVEFGDGYDQTVPDGLNSVRETWDLNWTNIPESAANDIEDQLDALLGRPFEWTTPKGVTKNFTCKKMSKNYAAYGSFNVTAQFVESFSL